MRKVVVKAGETFALEMSDDGTVFLSHPRWSLVGSGNTPQEAGEDLYDEARQLADVLMDMDAVKMSPDMINLRDFLLRII